MIYVKKTKKSDRDIRFCICIGFLFSFSFSFFFHYDGDVEKCVTILNYKL